MVAGIYVPKTICPHNMVHYANNGHPAFNTIVQLWQIWKHVGEGRAAIIGALCIARLNTCTPTSSSKRSSRPYGRVQALNRTRIAALPGSARRVNIIHHEPYNETSKNVARIARKLVAVFIKQITGQTTRATGTQPNKRPAHGTREENRFCSANQNSLGG